MMVGIAVETTVDSNDASAVTRTSANVTRAASGVETRGSAHRRKEVNSDRPSHLSRRRGGLSASIDFTAMRILVGTSGYSYKEWKGTFYPEDLPATQMLALLRASASAPSRSTTPSTACPSPSARRLGRAGPARLSLRAEGAAADHAPEAARTREDVDLFTRGRTRSASALGPILFQLPPYLQEGRAAAAAFLALLPRRARRRSSSATRRGSTTRSSTRCASTRPRSARGRRGARGAGRRDRRLGLPAPAPRGLRRRGFHGVGRTDPRQDVGEAYVFFKHEDAGRGPEVRRASTRASEVT